MTEHVHKHAHRDAEIKEAIELMEGFVSMPYGTNEKRDEALRRIWQGRRKAAAQQH